MYKIYLSDKVIIITNDRYECKPSEGDCCVDLLHDDSIIDQTKLLKKLQTTKRLILLTNYCDRYYDKLVEQFRVITAAGGLVINNEGDVLMIYRLGKWDLPKGKLEPGEDIEECAVREVGEECGVWDVEIERKLTVTSHLYQIDDEWVLKQTHWYRMECCEWEELTPQREEGIMAVEWVIPNRIYARLSESYATIVDVYESVFS